MTAYLLSTNSCNLRGTNMTKKNNRVESARAAALRVLDTLPKAAESLESNLGGVEAMGISAQSVESLAGGFREIVQSLEQADLESTFKPTGISVVAESVESAANSIQSFISSIEAAGIKDVDENMAFKLGKLSGAAELIVESLESAEPSKD